MFKYFDPNNPHLKNVDYFGGNAPFRSKQHASDVAKTSLYFTFLFAVILLGVFVTSVVVNQGQWGNYDFLVLGSIYLYMSYLVKFYMSRAAAIIMTVLTVAVALLLVYLNKFEGTAILILGMVFIASYRCIKATFYYQKKVAEENV